MSSAQNHYFGRFYERRGLVSYFEPHLAHRVGRHDGRNVLAADRKTHLRNQPADLDIRHPPDQLVAATNIAKAGSLCCYLTFVTCAVKEFVELALGNTVMTARRLNSSNLALVDPQF